MTVPNVVHRGTSPQKRLIDPRRKLRPPNPIDIYVSWQARAVVLAQAAIAWHGGDWPPIGRGADLLRHQGIL
jgi:hypothetical protein